VFPLLAKQFFHFEAIIRSSVDKLSSLAASPESLQDLRIVKYLDQMNMPVDVASITGFVKENLPGALDQIGKFVTQGGKSFFTWVFGFFGAFSNAVLYFIFLIFILAERKELFRSLVSFLPKQTASEIGKRVPKIQTTLLSWWKGQAILCSFIGIMTLIVLVILSAAFGIRVENHLSLALIAGLCEFIPILGPMIAMVPALLIGIQ
jgi:predicted PurR-regulated permease PerM